MTLMTYIQNSGVKSFFFYLVLSDCDVLVNNYTGKNVLITNCSVINVFYIMTLNEIFNQNSVFLFLHLYTLPDLVADLISCSEFIVLLNLIMSSLIFGSLMFT